MDAAKDLVLSKLTPKEREAYEKYMADDGKPLAFSAQLRFYELFLNGNSCEEIWRLNQAFPLGAIVRARIESNWDDSAEEYRAHMLESVRQRVQQAQLEAIFFTADLLSVAHKLYGDKLKRFQQTGNPDDLGPLAITNLKSYKDVVDLLMKLTGQDKDSKVKGEVLHKHTMEAPPVPADTNHGLTQEQAAKLLEILDRDKK